MMETTTAMSVTSCDFSNDNSASFNAPHHYQQHHSHYHVVNSISSTTSSLTSSPSVSGVMSVNGSSGGDSIMIDSSASQHQQQSDSFVNPTNLIVNYLPQTMTEAEMKSLFEQIDYVERCKLIKNKLNQSLCYGFVKYAKPESAERAIQRFNGLKIENKIVKVILTNLTLFNS